MSRRGGRFSCHLMTAVKWLKRDFGNGEKPPETSLEEFTSLLFRDTTQLPNFCGRFPTFSLSFGPEHLQLFTRWVKQLSRLGVVDHALKIDDNRRLVPDHPGVVTRGKKRYV